MNGRWTTRTIALAGAGLLLAACMDRDPLPMAPRLDGPTYNWLSLSNGFGTVTGNKTLSLDELFCDGSLTVTLTLDAQTGIAGEPADIMLVLDRSGSMGGAPLAALKDAASAFVDIIFDATGGVPPGQESRIGVVSFASSASLDQGLTTSSGDLKSAINALSAGGLTAIGDGLNLAQAQFTGTNNIIILFTDGVNNAGANPVTAATNAKNAGTVIYAIGLGGVNVAALNSYASEPSSDHVFVTPDADDLQAIFEAIGAAIVAPADLNVTVVDVVNSDFSVSDVVVTKGTASVVDNMITWEVGDLMTETATLTYTATHDPDAGAGIKQVNESVVYTGDAGHDVVFPNPQVTVRCPFAACVQSVNPHGRNIPQAPAAGGQGQNQDGFYQLLGEDGVGGEVQMFVTDTGSGTVFGPYPSGTTILYTQAPGATPRETRIGSDSGQAGAVTVHIIGQGDAEVTAVDVLGQESAAAACLVPPPPM